MNYQKKAAYTGHIDQLLRVKDYKLQGGRQDSVRVIEVDSGGGLELTVLPDRGLDFYQVRFKGKNANYIAPCGIVAPELSRGYLDSFFAGFLTTCGMDNIGNDCVDEGKNLPMHGSLSLTPAEEVNVEIKQVDGVPEIRICGQMVQAALFGSNLVLKRTIACRYGESRFSFTDEITNNGQSAAPFMLLYHFNAGYPLLSEGAVLDIPSQRVTPLTEHAEKHKDKWQEVTPPTFPYTEMCYYHDIVRPSDGIAQVGITNPAAGMKLAICYNRDLLDNFVQWKQLGKGEYAMGLEPCNATIRGRATAREDGSLKFLQSGERKTYEFDIRFTSV